VRLQWWGLYHDKPKVGTFMLRIKLPSGHLTPAKLRVIGEVANEYGRGDGELSTRQNVQLHWLELAALPEVLDRLDAAGLRPARALRLLRRRRGGGTVLLRQPRLRRPAAEAQRAEINCFALRTGARRRRRPRRSRAARFPSSGSSSRRSTRSRPPRRSRSRPCCWWSETSSLARQTAARSLAIAAGGAPAASSASSAAPRTGGAVTGIGLAAGARSASRATTSS
jgi:Nitrite/Sulfite reductase ferredoxin-like half domain